MPLLALVVDLRIAVPVMGLIAFVIAIGVLARAYREIDLAAMRRLLLGALVGIPLGVVVLQTLPERVLTVTLALVLVAFALYRLTSPRLPRLEGRWWAYPFGVAAGACSAAYNVGGPPLVVYGALRGWEPARFRATLQGYFLVSSILVAASHAVAGLWSREVLWLAAASLPAVLVGLLAGHRLHDRLEPERFDGYLSWLLLVLGMLLLV